MKHKVVLVPFPFDDLSSAKVRPAVCLTEPLSTDLVFAETDKDFSVTGLRVSSTLQLHRMMTVAANIIVRELGTLPKFAQKEVERKLKLLFGIK